MITPSELRQGAEQLVEGTITPGTEFLRRVTISRLYYAVFHELGASAISQALPRAGASDGGMHKAFANRLLQSTDKEVRRAAQRLAALHQRRVDADYNLARNISQMDVREAQHAADAVRRLTGL